MMRNLHQLLAMRRAGVKPAHVCISDQRRRSDEAWWKHAELQRYAELEIEPTDNPKLADLRAVVGLPVLVDIRDDHLREQWVQAAKAAGAVPVYAVGEEVEAF